MITAATSLSRIAGAQDVVGGEDGRVGQRGCLALVRGLGVGLHEPQVLDDPERVLERRVRERVAEPRQQRRRERERRPLLEPEARRARGRAAAAGRRRPTTGSSNAW